MIDSADFVNIVYLVCPIVAIAFQKLCKIYIRCSIHQLKSYIDRCWTGMPVKYLNES